MAKRTTSQLLIDNIKQLVTVSSNGRPFKSGPEMKELGLLNRTSVLIEDGIIREIGSGIRTGKECEKVDASELIGMPGFVDSHTHLVFAGAREEEFAMRSAGASYQTIAEQGGGILSTVRATRSATKKELKKLASHRLDAMMRQGTTTVEIKSGYGLDEKTEIKMLEVISELSSEHFATIVPTFLGAHAVPPEFQVDREAYVSVVRDRMLPYVAKKKLAVFCDIFCEHGYFTLEQSATILREAKKLGLNIKIHADELSASGGSSLAAQLGAVSADHLEHIDDKGIQNLKEAGVVAVLLPGVSFFLRHGYAPARSLIDAGVPVAIASDFNPGSCMSFSMPLMMTIACTQMHMTPEEAITACTLNGAAALGLSQKVGSVEVGKEADMILYDVPNYRFLPYYFGTNHVKMVIKHGTILEYS